MSSQAMPVPDPFSMSLFGESEIVLPSQSGVYQESRRGNSVIELPRQEYIPRVLEDRWYQTQALEEIERRMPKKSKRKNGKGELLKSPTGCGKTSIASRAIGAWRQRGERVLILVDMERLLDQMYDDLTEEGIYPLVEKAEHSALAEFGRHGGTVLASMQTLHTKRLHTWATDAFDKIVIDEAHEMRWLHIVEYFKEAHYLGLTATPIRADGKSLKDYFNYPYIQTLTLREAIEGYNGITGEYEKPFLSRIRIETIPAPEIDLSKIRIVGKDFDQRELDREIWKHTNFIASSLIEAAGDRPTWIYCPRIPTSDAIAEAMRDMGAKAASYTSKTPNPRELMKRFESGDLQFLCNVNMLIKGVNVRKVSCIGRVKQSMNIAAVTQEIGRGTRLSPETNKENCLVLEFDCSANGEQKIASVIDAILDGVDDPDKKPTKAEKVYQSRVRNAMDRIVKTKKELDLIKAQKLAKAEISAEDEQKKADRDAAKRAKYKKVEVSKTRQVYDPFAGLTKQGEFKDSAAHSEPATADQIALIADLSGGVVPGHRLSKQAADKRISDLETRKKYRYASEKQLRFMINSLGCDPIKAARLKSWEASQWMDNRRLEMVQELEGHGYDPVTLCEAKLGEIAKMHSHITKGA